MRLRRVADPGTFLSATESPLAAREAYFNLPLSIARHCVSDPTRYPGRNYFATIEDDAGRVCGAAVMTPPHRLLLYASAEAAGVVAHDLERGGWPVPGVHAPAETAAAFITAWCVPRALIARQRMALRVFELTAVVPAPPVPGRMRAATANDLPVVGTWYRAFTDEAQPGLTDRSPEDIARRAVVDGRVFVWDHDGAVAQAAVSGSTPRGARVGAVYTPPDRRRSGYATALVAALSAHLLANGRSFTFLFTDLSNPVSNSIYPKVGYRALADLHEFEFAAA